MAQKNKTTFTLLWLLSAVILAVMAGLSAWAWFQLPADALLPVHWNVAGEVDRYGSKWEGLWLLPAVSLGIILLFRVIRAIDPLRANLERSMQAYHAVLLGTLFFMAVLHVGAVLAAVGYPINIGLLAAPALGVLFIIIGNYMGKIRRNYMLGVRTPWTLTSELSWNKTHRLTGKLFILSGLLIIAASFWSATVAFYTMMGTLLGTVAFALIYSYLIWKRDPARQTTKENGYAVK
ncbi:MAG: SdpI family protein [Caldilineaceae bacterium]|nr:SdpI family protein [Caldilineaceae bacterium]